MAEPEHEPTIAIEREFVGRRVRVQVERVRLDDGTETLRDMVYHPDSVVIVPLDDDGNLVMVRQYRKAAGRELLELPAGVMDPGDASPLEAARRELREETGLDADDLLALGNFFAAPGSLTERLYSYLARGLRVSPLPPGRGRTHRGGARRVQGCFADGAGGDAQRREDAGIAAPG